MEGRSVFWMWAWRGAASGSITCGSFYSPRIDYVLNRFLLLQSQHNLNAGSYGKRDEQRSQLNFIAGTGKEQRQSNLDPSPN
jgi:hypothetical protein